MLDKNVKKEERKNFRKNTGRLNSMKSVKERTKNERLEVTRKKYIKNLW